jgi:uncharacterized phage protein gp47/JayE
MSFTPQQYYKIGENKFIETINQKFGRDLTLEINPEIRTILECLSTLLGNGQKEQTFLQQQFIENPLTYKTLTSTENLPAGLAKGKITFNADIAGISINETNTLQGVNNILYDPLDIYESIAVSIPILNIESDGLGTITVEAGEDLISIATGNTVNIVNVNDSDFNINNIQVTVIGMRMLTYPKNIVAKTSVGGTVNGITLTVEVESQTFGNIGNLANGKVVNILSPLQDLSTTGYVNFTNITGGVDEETDEALSGRISIKLRQDTTTANDAQMRNEALEYPGTTRAWVETSQVTANINVWHMRDGSIPPFPTTQDNVNLLNHLISTGAVPAGILYDNIIVQAPSELQYNLEFTILYNELDNNEYKEMIQNNLERLFETLELNQRATTSNIKSIITTQTIGFYPDILQTDGLLDNLINGIIVSYTPGITGVVISTLGTIEYPL